MKFIYGGSNYEDMFEIVTKSHRHPNVVDPEK